MSIRKELTAQNVLLGFQHVLVSNVWLDPVFVAGAIGLPIALSSNMINAIFIVSGLVTLVQATRLVRLPVVQGPSAAFDALMIAAGTAGMLGAASSSILIASLVFLLLCLTGVIERMRFLFSPMISGVVIFMVGVSLSGFTLSEFLGGAPGDKTFADPHILTVSILTTAIVLVLSLLGKGLLKSFSFLIALVVGTVVAAAFGMVDFSPVASKGWLGLPTFLPYGPFTFDWKIFIPFFIAYMVAVMEALGVYQAASEIQGTSLERKQVRYGLAGEAAGSAISSLIGGFTTTAYPQNVGLLNLTGEGKLRTRTPVIIAAVLLLILGFVPKAGALLSVIPSAVVGGIFLPAAASLIVTGLRALRKGRSGWLCDLTPDAVARRIRSACMRAGAAWTSMTECRHTWATLAVEAGVGIETVALMLGHTDISTAYEHYIVPRARVCRDAQKQVEQLIMRA